MTSTPTRTSAQLLDGRRVAAQLLAECGNAVATLTDQFGVTPHLAVILVGEDPASAIYVGAKVRACAKAGVRSTVVRLPASTTTDALLHTIDSLCEDQGVHGLIVQLPLPAAIDTCRVIAHLPADKDVDGFHLHNVGRLVLGDTMFTPCTPEGVIRLLDDAGIGLTGANMVVVGASNIVGKPMALMALHRQATVTVCHARSRDLAAHTRAADILICAAGRPNLITADMVMDGAVVIDVGINRLPDGAVTGDVDFDGVSAKASYITPVPGGVGPMTVAVLITNTVRAAQRVVGLPAVPPVVGTEIKA